MSVLYLVRVGGIRSQVLAGHDSNDTIVSALWQGEQGGGIVVSNYWQGQGIVGSLERQIVTTVQIECALNFLQLFLTSILKI